jgi:predicted nuclease with TOPRIM domain
VTYQKKISELQQQVSTLEKKFEQKFKKNIGDLKEQFNELQLEMNRKLEELRKERLHRQEANMKLILEYLENGKIQSAWMTFKDKLMGPSTTKITAIVKSAIGNEFGTNITTENLIKFTEGLQDDADAMSHGAIQLFKELEHRQALDVETVHVLNVTVGNIINKCKALEGTDFETLKLILDEDTVDQLIHVYNKLEFWLKYVHHQS